MKDRGIILFFLILPFTVQSQIDTSSNKIVRKFIKTCDSCFTLKNYPCVKMNFTKAYDINTKDERLQKKLNYRVKHFLYSSIIIEADSSFYNKQWEKAFKEYDMAEENFPGDKYSLDQMDKCRANIPTRPLCGDPLAKNKIIYDEFRAKADTLFGDRKYTEAKNEFNNALKLFPDDAYCAERVKLCDKFLWESKNLLYTKLFDERKRIIYEGTVFENKYYSGKEYLYHKKKKKKFITKEWVEGVEIIK